MATWYKQGVYGELRPEAEEGRRKTERLYARKGEDLFITSIREGTHTPGSFHPGGGAWDQRPGKVSLAEHKKELGKNFDIIDHGEGASFHRHVEYDPK